MSPAGLVVAWVGALGCLEARDGIGRDACLRFEGTLGALATLEPSGQITLVTGASQTTALRVSTRAVVTSQPVFADDGGSLPIVWPMTSGEHGVWLCGQNATPLKLLPSGRLVAREGSCESWQVPNLGIVQTGNNRVVRRLPDGGSQVLVAEGPPGEGVKPYFFLSIAGQPDGGYTVEDPARCAFLRGEGGTIRHLAGPLAETGRTDGTRSRLLGAPKRMIASHDTALFLR